MKNKLSFLVMLVIMAGIVVFTGCFSGPKVEEMYHQNWGTFGEATRIPVKDFETLGFVWTEKTFTVTDSDNAVISGDVFTYQALLKEAELKEADAIINVVIDRRIENIKIPTGRGEKAIRKEIWYGSALAIKYTNVIPQANQTTLTTNNPRAYTVTGGASVLSE